MMIDYRLFPSLMDPFSILSLPYRATENRLVFWLRESMP